MMNIQKGLVSVIMTNYNTPEAYLRQAIDSILNQTYTNFEFIIVDDASTDNSLSVIESYQDKRIIILKNEENIGLTKSLNRALEVCKGEFVARMDSDDISESIRFEKQVDFLTLHPEVIVCGTGAQLFGDWQKHNSREYICNDIPIREKHRIYLLFGNYPSLVHISALFNRNLMCQNSIKYDENYIYAQDYKIWVDCANCAQIMNISEALVKVRVREGTISTSKKSIQGQCAERIAQEQLDKLHLTMTDEIKQFHMNLFSRKGIPFDLKIKEWLQTIIEANKQYHIYNQKLLRKILMEKWTEIFYYGLTNKATRAQALKSLNIVWYPKLINIYISRKRKRRHG